jgi:hypothetical protein
MEHFERGREKGKLHLFNLRNFL